MLALALAAVTLPVCAGVASAALPPSLVAAIAALDPAAVPVEPVDIDDKACGAHPGHPGRLVADFNGDGHTDYAMYLRSKRAPRGAPPVVQYAVRFAIFLGDADGGFLPRVLREWQAGLPLQERLVLQRPGRIREVEGGDDRVVTLRYPGIIELVCGKAASTYFWTPRSQGFEYMVTAE